MCVCVFVYTYMYIHTCNVCSGIAALLLLHIGTYLAIACFHDQSPGDNKCFHMHYFSIDVYFLVTYLPSNLINPLITH